MDLQTLVGGALAAGGALWAGWTWVKSKAPKAADLVEEVVSRIQGQNAAPVIPGRLEALEQAEALLRYMEAKGNTVGAEALLAVVKEILTSKA